MNLLNNKEVLVSLLKEGDVLNTIHGGRIEPKLNILKKRHAFIIEVVAPTLSIDTFNIFLDYHKLILNLLPINPFEHAAARHPIYTRFFQIPSYVNSDAISAHFERGTLTVTLPFRKLSQQQRRQIRIEHL